VDHEKYPELNVAKIITERNSLSYPLDIFHASHAFANIKYITPPPGIDGFVIFNKCTKHDIYINSANSKPRQAFTIAHELGHIFIPWHPCATISCSISEAARHTHPIESEANRFASELLMPTSWVKDLLNYGGVTYAITTLTTNSISLEAACIAIQRSAATPICIDVFNHSSGKSKSYASRSFPHNLRSRSADSIPPSLVGSTTHTAMGNVTISILELNSPNSPPQTQTGHKSVRELFDSMLLENTSIDKQRLWSSFTGIIAGLNSKKSPPSFKDLYQKAILRISSREDLSVLYTHPDFSNLVGLRCKELCKRRTT